MKTKIDCERILALLKNGYLDNELDGAARDLVNRHLQECPVCRRIKENLEAISLLLRNTPRANQSENLWARIQADIWPERVPRVNPSVSLWRVKLSENISAARFRYFLVRRNALAFATAAVLVAAAIGFYFGAGRSDNGEFAPSLTSLIGNDEIRESDMNFGSNIEKYLL